MEQNELQKIKELEKAVSDERKRLSTDRMDISFGELINLYKNNELVIRPEYQRLYRWTEKQKTALIESILLSIPIPPIFVSEDKEGVWELVDGLQRVATFISFFGELNQEVGAISDVSDMIATVTTGELSQEDINSEEEDYAENNISDTDKQYGNKWTLLEGGLIKALEGFNIDTIPTNLKINLKRAVCRVEILRGESSTQMKYELFKRLNSGGSKLTPQEIRNAIYRGINPSINILVQQLSKNLIFKKLTELSPTKKQQLYDQELILRFIAFYNNADNVDDNTENYLNTFMERETQNNSFDTHFYEKRFMDTINLIDQLNDAQIFRNKQNLFVPAYFEGITIALAQNLESYQHNLSLLEDKIEYLKTDSIFKKLSGSGSSSKLRNKLRLNRANEIFKVNNDA